MKRTAKLIFVLCLAASIVIVPVGAMAASFDISGKEASAESMIGDVLVARPLGLLSVVVGTSFFAVSLPFSLIGGNTGDAMNKMVVDPVKYTFARPLGEF